MRSLAALIAALAMGAVPVSRAATPSFLFNAASIDPAVFPVVEKYFRNSDFIGVRVLAAYPRLRQKIDRAHQFELADGLASVQAEVDRGCGAESPGTIWYLAPLAGTREFADPLGSIASAVRKIQASGCHQVGMSPSAQFWGYTRVCEYNLATSPYHQVDWAPIDRLNIQGEGMLNPSCKTGVADYLKLVTTVTSYVRAKNPKIMVFAHVSFRFTPPALLIQGIEAMAGVVDGFLLSYPLYGEHVYCTAENMETVLKVFRSSAP
jgi:hypothetical protein